MFVLAAEPPAATHSPGAEVDALATRLVQGDLVLIERECAPGDMELIRQRISEVRPDLAASEASSSSGETSHGHEMPSPPSLAVDLAYCPPPLPLHIREAAATAPREGRFERLVGGTTPEAADRAKEVLEQIFSGPMLLTDARAAEAASRIGRSLAEGGGPDPGASVHPKHAEPVLSIVMPAYNAEQHIRESISSVLEQDLRELELIVVDDGSEDSTAALVTDLAEDDTRVHLVRQSNAGPGVARNRGVEAARGRYLAFADADDRVLPGAYSALVASLEDTGADIATGTYVRVGATGTIRPQLSERVHAEERTGIDLSQAPELVEEPVLWNKVFRRRLWDGAVRAVPIARNYEDQEPVFRALLGASSIDVLTRDVYAWRLPDGRATRSRGQHRRRNLRARLAVVEAAEELFREEPADVRAHAYAAWLGRDLMLHAAQIPVAKKRFRRLLFSAAAGLVRRMPESAWSLIPAQDRFLAAATAAGSLEDVEEILGTRAEETSAVPLVPHQGVRWCSPTYLERLSNPVPDGLRRAQDVDFRMTAGVRTLEWRAPNEAVLAGFAYIPGIDPADAQFELIGRIGGHVVMRQPMTRRYDAQAAQESNDPWHDYSQAGFSATLWLPPVRPGQSVSLYARARMRDTSALGAVRIVEGPLSTATASLPAPLPSEAGEEDGSGEDSRHHSSTRWVARSDARAHMSLEAVHCPPTPLVVTGVHISRDAVELRMPVGPTTGTVVALSAEDTVHFAFQREDSRGAILVASAPHLPARLHSGGERFLRLVHRRPGLPDTAIPASAALCGARHVGALRLSPDSSGNSRLAQRAFRVSVTSVEQAPDDTALLFRGCADVSGPEALTAELSLHLRTSAHTIPLTAEFNPDGTFTARAELCRTGAEGGRVAVPCGGYFLRFTSPSTGMGWARAAGNGWQTSHVHASSWCTATVEERPGAAVAVIISPPLRVAERTRYGQFQLRSREWGPLTEGIVFESFNGKGTAGNARALFEAVRTAAPSVPCWWSIRDRSTEVPKGARPLVMGTEEWHRVMATARVWVNDNNFPYFVRKRPGQYYLQTWHGTPIKRLLWDLPRRKSPLTYRRLMRSEVAQWDLLLAQSEEAAANLCTGLGYHGDVLVGEYPRNDRLRAGASEIAEIRARLGIAPGTRVILYAPTWRNVHRNGQRMHWDDYLDPAALAEAAGALVLVRAHHVTQAAAMDAPGILDVSDEPHVEDLMLAADVLVTDYSSLAFDFEVTGKPVIHYVPDIEDYRRERGFYPQGEQQISTDAVRNPHELCASADAALARCQDQSRASGRGTNDSGVADASISVRASTLITRHAIAARSSDPISDKAQKHS